MHNYYYFIIILILWLVFDNFLVYGLSIFDFTNSDSSVIEHIDINQVNNYQRNQAIENTENHTDTDHSLSQIKNSHLYSDNKITMVVGQQIYLSGDFERQIALSKKSVLNIKWITSEKILVTALKKGVILFNPTPQSLKHARWLITVISEYQAKQRNKKNNKKPLANSKITIKPNKKTIKSKETNKNLKKLLNELSYLIIKQKPHQIIIDCFHPKKHIFKEIITQTNPEITLGCAQKNFNLEIFIQKDEKDYKKSRSYQKILNTKSMPVNKKDLNYKILHSFNIIVSPSLNEIDYFLDSKQLSVNLSDILIKRSRMSKNTNSLINSDNILIFEYNISLNATQTNGIFSKKIAKNKIYQIGKIYSDSEFTAHSVGNIISNMPIIGFLFSSLSKKAKKTDLSIKLKIN